MRLFGQISAECRKRLGVLICVIVILIMEMKMCNRRCLNIKFKMFRGFFPKMVHLMIKHVTYFEMLTSVYRRWLFYSICTLGYVTMSSFINKFRMLQRTQKLQRTRRNTIGLRSTRVPMTFRAFSLWLERQSSSLLSLIKFSYQFSSAICLFVQCKKVK